MRKTILRTLALSLLLFCLLSASAYAQTAVVTGDGVNLRAGPGINYEVLGCYDKGTVVTVHEKTSNGWYSVTVEGIRGFMAGNYLRLNDDGPTEPDPTPTPTAAPTQPPAGEGEPGYINAMYVRFRSGPSLDATILGEYNKGTRLTITGTSGDWTAVIINGARGYVYSTYVSRGDPDGSTPTPTAAPTPTPAPTAPPTDGTNATLIKDDVYLYNQPSYYADIKGAFNKGDRLTVNAVNGDWATVVIFGYPGYINMSNIGLDNGQTPTPTPTPTPTGGATDGYVNADHVHLRAGPSTSSAIKAVLNKGDRVTITGSSGEWKAVSVQGTPGYIYGIYVTADGPAPTPTPTQPPVEPTPTLEPTPTPAQGEPGYITGNNVRLREEPSMNGRILGEYNAGTKLTITGYSGEWTAVIINGTSGYVFSTYVAKGEITVPTDPPGGGGDTAEEGRQMAEFALQFVGYPYVWAGQSPDVGFDCSGLAYYTYTHFGYKMYRVANDQTRNGVHVDPADLQPGDLLCFYSGGSYVGHVGIYIGGGKFVHASTYTTGVIVSELSGYYTTRGFEARRIAGTSKDGPGD